MSVAIEKQAREIKRRKSVVQLLKTSIDAKSSILFKRADEE